MDDNNGLEHRGAGPVNGRRHPRMLLVVTSAMTAKAFLPPIVRSLTSMGVEVDVACGPGGTTDIGGAPTHTIPFDRSASPGAAVRAMFALRRLVKDLEPDALVCATPVAALVGVITGRLLHVRLIAYLCWGLRSETLSGVLRNIVAACEDLTVRLADLTIANSSSLCGVIASRQPTRAARVILLGKGSSHGVDLKRFSFSPAPSTNSVPKIGFVGRIRRDKGIVELLEATAQMTKRGVPLELELTGLVEDKELEGMIADRQGVHIRGATDSINRVMQGLDILCLPSWREGFPNVVLEASATGRPVVVSDATGAVDSVVDGVTGLAFHCRDVDALDGALSWLLAAPERREAMGRAGRKWVEDNFEEGHVCNLLAARLLRELGHVRRGRHGLERDR